MSELFFWNRWRRSLKFTYQILLFLFLASVLFVLFSLAFGEQTVFSWEILKTYSPLELPIDIIPIVFSGIPVLVEHYPVTETFQGSDIHVPAAIYAMLGICSGLILSVFIGVFTTLSRFWYLFSITATTLVLLALRLEQIVLFDSTENIALFLALLVYFSLSFFFHAIKPHISLPKRIAAFVAASVILGVIFDQFSNIAVPYSYIGSYGIIFPIALTIVFIILVSHEILSGFLFLITSGNTVNSKNSLMHFLIISGIYLAWVLLTYLHNMSYIKWDLLYIDSTLLLVVSAIVGIWGFRDKCQYVFSFIPFYPSGAILYLTLAIGSFLTLGSFYFLANEPMLEMLEDVIIFSHLGVGIIFFVYIIGNFAALLLKNLNVYKVQYKPKNMPYFTANLGGLIFIGVLIAGSQLVPYFQGLSGYYNGLGDLHLLDRQLFLSEQYYKLARSYAPRNHRSNYALGSLARKQGDEALALKYFNDALLKKPSTHAYLNVGNIYQDKSRFFDALFTLKEGLTKFPESDPIKNNLGVLFSKTSILDSALVYLQAASLDTEVGKSAEVNMLKLAAALRLPANTDSLVHNFTNFSYLPYKNNALIRLNQYQTPLKELNLDNLNVDKRDIDAEAFTFWYEYGINQAFNPYDSQTRSLLDSIAKDSLNAQFQSELTFASAIHQYYHHHVGKAFLSMEKLINSSSFRAGYYNYLLGLWSFEQKAFRHAAEYFKRAQLAGHQDAVFPLAVALTASGNYSEALLHWEVISKKGTGTQQKTAELTKLAFKDISQEDIELSDSLAFLKLYFDIRRERIEQLVALANPLEDHNLKVRALFLIIDKAIKERHTTSLNPLFDALEKMPLSNDQRAGLATLKLRYFTATNKIFKIQDFISDSSMLTSLKDTPEYLHYQANQAYLKKNSKAAKEYFLQLGQLNPFFEEGVIASAAFFQQEDRDEATAYQILLKALELNPYSESLQKAYILQCLNMQLISYSEKSLHDLKELASPSEYADFLLLYNHKKDSLQQVYNQWQ